MKETPKDFRIAYVRWRDSQVFMAQESGTVEDFMPCVIETVGIVVGDTKDYVVIAREKVDRDWRGVISIPRENIVTYQKQNLKHL